MLADSLVSAADAASRLARGRCARDAARRSAGANQRVRKLALELLGAEAKTPPPREPAALPRRAEDARAGRREDPARISFWDDGRRSGRRDRRGRDGRRSAS